MKFGLNATCFNDRPSGAKQRFVGIYGELIKRLSDAEFVVYEPSDCRVASWFGAAPNVFARPTPLPSEGRVRKLVTGLGYWHSVLARERFDLFEALHLPLVKAPTGRTILTVHDLRGLGRDCGIVERAVYRTVLGRSLRAADHVVTVSVAMKEEILSNFPDLPISVVYNGLDAHAGDSDSEAEMVAVRRKLALPEDFILAVGHFEKRKNYGRLIDAMALLRDRGRACSLLVIGNDSGLKQVLEKQVAALALSDSISLVSGLSDLEVHCAYRLCKLFVFPSTYEGFGIPLLEAMAAGRPMVVSDLPVFREITQDRGNYFEPYAVESIAQAIENVLASTSEQERLAAYGRHRVLDFSFESLAARIETVYRSLI